MQVEIGEVEAETARSRDGLSASLMTILLLSFGVALADQATKALAWQKLDPLDPIVVIPGFLNLRYVTNTGAAWGMFQGWNVALTLVSVVMLIALVRFRDYFVGGSRAGRVAMGLLIGGIVGNLIDRIKYGYVVDFLDFHLAGRHFPAFNVADAAICVGVGTYVISQLLSASRTGPKRSG